MSTLVVSVAASTMLAFITWLALQMAITDAKQQTLALIAGGMTVAVAGGALAYARPRQR